MKTFCGQNTVQCAKQIMSASLQNLCKCLMTLTANLVSLLYCDLQLLVPTFRV